MAFSPTASQIIKRTSTFLELFDQVWKGFNTMATNSKISKLIPKIGTHNGMFHCDEIFACFMLKQLPKYKDAEIIRTRDENLLSQCNIVVDVGGVYNPKTERFDHHQREFNETLSSVRPDLVKNKFIRLSSAGLIYAHYGLEVITEILKANSIILDQYALTSVYTHIYDIFVEELDAIDNGIPICPEGEPRYKIYSHLSARVAKFYPKWNSTDDDEETIYKLFLKAKELVGNEFTETVLEAVNVWWPAREIVKRSIEDRFSVHKSGEIFFLGERCSWKDHLYYIEEELNIVDQLKFCIFYDKANSWRVQAVPVQPSSFVCRVFFT